MLVKDYDLIHNIDILFEKKIVIYGMGYFGKKIAERLNEFLIPIAYFCDRNSEISNDMGIPLININELKEISSREEITVIIGSQKYQEEIIDLLDRFEIQAYVCTWYGVQVAIEVNLSNTHISQKTREDYLYRKDLVHQSFWMQYLFGIFYDLWRYPHAIWVYQPGKVGSSTIRNTLEKVNRQAVHFHWIKSDIINEMNLQGVEDLYKRQSLLLEKEIQKNKNVKIITLVRDPLARELSEFMQRFMFEYINVEIAGDIADSARKFIERRLQQSDEWNWFNKEIKELTGIDVFSYPFDREKGYVRIKKGNVEILVLKMEQMSKNAQIIGEFIGEPELVLENANVGTQKHYKYIYDELRKRFKITKSILIEQYNTTCFNHFYTMEEKCSFLEKWEKNMEE